MRCNFRIPFDGAVPWTHQDTLNPGFNDMNQDIDRQYNHTPVLTVSQAAKFMGVGKQIIYQLIEFGEIKAIRERRAILLEKRSLEQYRNSGKLT